MEENLVGYLLNALDENTHREVEVYLRTQPEAQGRLELLRRSLRPLEADRGSFEPPPGLVERTIARAQKERSPDIIPMPVSVAARVPVRPSWWHRSDVLVAAGLLICVVGLGAPGVYRLRAYHQSRTECAENMRVMHQSLVHYADTHNGALPRVEERPRRNVPGIFVPTLVDAGTLTRTVNVRCPANGQPANQAVTLSDLDGMSQEDFDRHARRMAGCYAYALGYRDAQGRLQGHRIDDGADLPILADRPLTDEQNEVRGNSPNHAGGQNVLYIGGHVRFTKTPTVGVDNDHIYLNRMNKVAAGVDRDDAVLGAGADMP